MLFPVVALALFASSCRTVTPIDPMQMKQSCKCLPGHFKGYGSQCQTVVGTK
ncbi:MAG: hypothetical protein ABIQ96_23175 [Luteolibacter sp.]